MAEPTSSLVALDRAGRQLEEHTTPCPYAHAAGDSCSCPWDGSGDPDAPGASPWNRWVAEDDGACDQCGAETRVAPYYGEGDDGDWACLPCVLRHHARDCGCDRWRDAEEAFGVERATMGAGARTP